MRGGAEWPDHVYGRIACAAHQEPLPCRFCHDMNERAKYATEQALKNWDGKTIDLRDLAKSKGRAMRGPRPDYRQFERVGIAEAPLFTAKTIVAWLRERANDRAWVKSGPQYESTVLREAADALEKGESDAHGQ